MRRCRDYVIVMVSLAIGWAFWLHRMGVNDPDDMLSNELIFARQGVASLLFRIPWPDQSPLYFVYLHVVRSIGESAFALHLGNAVLLTFTLVVTWLFALAFSGSRVVAGAAMLLGTVSPASLWLVRSGRMYSLQVFFSVLGALFVLRYRERRRPSDLVALGLISALNIYTHFFGFLVTALLFAPLLAEAWVEARRLKTTGSAAKAWQPLLPLVLATAGVLVLALPQVVRLALLLGQGAPVRADVSLPVLSPRFLDRVGWFWFVNADWGALRPAEGLVTAVYLGSIALLALVGLVAVGRRSGIAAAFWILLPLATVGLAAARVDVRDRYFAWTLPLLWTAVATGGLSPLPSSWLKGARADMARGIRAALVLAVATASLWLLWNKLPERYAEWTKLMAGLERLYRPSMRVYMPPGSPMGSPRLLATQLHLPAGLRDVRNLSADTHEQFLKEVRRGEDFVFLVYGAHDNDEMRWRVGYLEEHAYEKAVVPVFGASALIFTHGAVEGFSTELRLAPDPSPETIVAWARQQLQGRRATPSQAPVLASAVVARVQPDGVVRMGRLFISQHGERGAWRLGPRVWDAVEEVRTSSGRDEQDVIAAHPASGSVLVVAFPALKLKKSLELSYGIADTGLAFRSGARVDLSFYVNGERRIDLSCPNTPGWKHVALGTERLEGGTADVVMLLTTPDDTSRHFAFRLESSSQPTPGPENAQPSGPVVLTGGRRLSDFVERLRVYRLEGDRRIDARSDGFTYSAGAMHEAAGAGGAGAVDRVWALGPLLWDAVGSTRQPSSGEVRKGIWAHPRNETMLIIEVPRASMGELLRGYFGFTDFSLERAKAVGVSAPVTFTVSIDGRAAFQRAASRTAGWTGLAIPTGGANSEHSVRIEISCAVDSWAHFIFDVWSD